MDDRDHQRMMIERVAQDGHVLDFPLLSDPDHRVIDRYGLFNHEDPRGREIAHPATFVLDGDGVVRWRFVEIDYKVRPTNQDVLEQLRLLN